MGMGMGLALRQHVGYIVSLPIYQLSWYGIWGKRVLFHLCACPYSVSFVCVYLCVFIQMCIYVCMCVHVCLSVWGYANCYADIIINSLGKQAGNKLGFEWVIVFSGMFQICIIRARAWGVAVVRINEYSRTVWYIGFGQLFVFFSFVHCILCVVRYSSFKLVANF